MIANPRDLSDEESNGIDDDGFSNNDSGEDAQDDCSVEMINESLGGSQVLHESWDGGSDVASDQSFVSSVYEEDEYNRWGKDSEDEFDDADSEDEEENDEEDDDDNDDDDDHDDDDEEEDDDNESQEEDDDEEVSFEYDDSEGECDGKNEDDEDEEDGFENVDEDEEEDVRGDVLVETVFEEEDEEAEEDFEEDNSEEDNSNKDNSEEDKDDEEVCSDSDMDSSGVGSSVSQDTDASTDASNSVYGPDMLSPERGVKHIADVATYQEILIGQLMEILNRKEGVEKTFIKSCNGQRKSPHLGILSTQQHLVSKRI